MAPLVLLHGGLGDAALHWAPIWVRLAERYRVFAPDLPGFGALACLPHVTFDAYLGWLDAPFGELEIPRAVLAGHAFGALIARLFAARHPTRLTHLRLIDGGMVPRINGVGRPLLGQRWLTGWMFELIRRQTYSARGLAQAFARDERVSEAFLSGARSASHIFSHTMRRLAPIALPDQQTPRVQTLLLWGGRDRLLRPGRGMRVAAEIPDAQFWVVRGVGHLPQLDQPDTFLEALQQFVEGE